MRDIDSLLRTNDPAANTPDYTNDEARALLLRATDAPARTRGGVGRRIAAVAAAAALVTGIGVLNFQGSAISARADEVLTQAAINAVDPHIVASQWWKVTNVSEQIIPDEQGVFDRDCRAQETRVRYVAVDGDRPSVTHYLGVELIKGTAQACGDFSGSESVETSNLSINDMPATWQTPTPEFLASLPRDVGELRDLIYDDSEGHGRDKDSEVFVFVSDVLRSGIVPADLRAALFEVLRTVPGIEVTSEEVIDGQTVVSLGIKDVNGYGEQMLVDPDGGVVVGERNLDLDGSAWWEESTARELVDAIPADVVAAAEMSTCEVTEDGGVACTKEK